MPASHDTPAAAGRLGGIPCTVVILTRNSARYLPRCLENLDHFDEIIVCDGDSDDETRSIAEAAGCHVIRQPGVARDATGALINYAEARNHAATEARSPWILTLDSDERLGLPLVDELSSVLSSVDGEVDAFELPFRYVVDDVEIDQAGAYPGHQIRVYRRNLKYAGAIHEKVAVQPDRIRRLQCWYYRYPPPARVLLRRWVRYGLVEASAYDQPADWWRSLGRLRISRVRWFVRGVLAARRMPGDRPMPRRYEYLRPTVELSLLSLDLPVVLWNRLRLTIHGRSASNRRQNS